MSATHHPKNSILIVEDEPDLCLLLELILNDGKTSISHVKSLEAAREFLNKELPNLLVLDNRLPDGLGLDFLPFITAHYPTLRVVMISGKDRSAGDLAIENGAHVFLAKPFTREMLYNSVHSLLNKPESKN